MKKIVVVILSILVLVGVFPQTFDYVFFRLNQSSIVRTLCIQKDEKINTCQGRCHLKKMMTESEDSKLPYQPKEKDQQNRSIYCIEHELLTLDEVDISSKSVQNFATIDLLDRLSTNRLIRPPDLG